MNYKPSLPGINNPPTYSKGLQQAIDTRFNEMTVVKLFQAINELRNRIARMEAKKGSNETIEFFKTIENYLFLATQQTSIIEELRRDVSYHRSICKFNSVHINDLEQRLKKYEVVEELIITETLDDFKKRIEWLIEQSKNIKTNTT